MNRARHFSTVLACFIEAAAAMLRKSDAPRMRRATGRQALGCSGAGNANHFVRNQQ
jgi:hypothetical protein